MQKEAIGSFLPPQLGTSRSIILTAGGVTLFGWGVRLNVGWVECMVLYSGGLRVLVEENSAPAGTKFVGRRYEKAPGCAMTELALPDLPQSLPAVIESNCAALSIAARHHPPPNIRDAHSVGITRLLSLPSPSYMSRGGLHIVQGGIANGDKTFLERVARGIRAARSWVVPKSVSIGDEVVIYIRGYGFFATGRIKSRSTPRTDWANRYGAGLDSISLIEPAISLAAIRRHVPSLEWAKYPRSITTPPSDVAEQIRTLIDKRRSAGVIDIDDVALASATIDELRWIALTRASLRHGKRAEKHLSRSVDRDSFSRLEAGRWILRGLHGCCTFSCDRRVTFPRGSPHEALGR